MYYLSPILWVMNLKQLAWMILAQVSDEGAVRCQLGCGCQHQLGAGGCMSMGAPSTRLASWWYLLVEVLSTRVVCPHTMESGGGENLSRASHLTCLKIQFSPFKYCER